jgi:hypothetical protein
MSMAAASPQIPESVTGPTNFAADAVITGTTRAPALMHKRATSTLLYAAMLPLTASAMVFPSRELGMDRHLGLSPCPSANASRAAGLTEHAALA